MNDNWRVCSKLSCHSYEYTRLFRHRVQTAVVFCNWETKLSLQWFLQCSFHILPTLILFCIYVTPNFTLFYLILFPLLFTFLSLLTFTCLLLIHQHLQPLPTPLFSYRFNHSESPSFPYPTSRPTLPDSAYSSVLKIVAPNSSKVSVLLHQLGGIKPRRQ